MCFICWVYFRLSLHPISAAFDDQREVDNSVAMASRPISFMTCDRVSVNMQTAITNRTFILQTVFFLFFYLHENTWQLKSNCCCNVSMHFLNNIV